MAAGLAPGNAAIHLAWARQLDLGGADPESELRAAALVDPRLAEPWLRLGLLAESRGDTKSAERFLLHGTAVSRQFLPRSVLTGFYFRQGNSAEFWHWARLSLEMSYGDRAPLFDLCWRMAGDPGEVYEKAVPRTHEVQLAYVEYLVARERFAAALGPAYDLIAAANSDARAVILQICDGLAIHSPAEALRLWNQACRVHLLPYEPVDPGANAAVVNAGFAHDPLQRGFDWKFLENPDISAVRLPAGGLRLSFSGHQPEAIDLLTQLLPVNPGSHYRLTVAYRTEAIPDPTGLLLGLEDGINRHPLQSTSLAAADQAGEAALAFDAPSSGVALIRFRYQRPFGSVRTDGRLTLRTVRIENQP